MSWLNKPGSVLEALYIATGAFDLWSTLSFLTSRGLTVAQNIHLEANPLARFVLTHTGLYGLIALKVLSIVIALWAIRRVGLKWFVTPFLILAIVLQLCAALINSGWIDHNAFTETLFNALGFGV